MKTSAIEHMLKILLIDDEPDALTFVGDYLSERGYTVITAMDGKAGLTCFDKENPDAVICDIRMPQMDGYEFLRELRKNRRWVPVVMLTALTDPEHILRSYDFQADHYLTKPINLEDLLRTLKVMESLVPIRRADSGE